MGVVTHAMLRSAAAVLVSLCVLQAVSANGRVYHRF